MITKSQEEYLKTIYIIKKQTGNIRVTDIAEKMNCTKPSVNKALHNLKNNNLINYETYGTIELTESGEKLAKKILEAYEYNERILDVDILKVGHHGSKTSSIDKFIAVVSPKAALIGVATNNKYGHPSNTTIDKLNNIKCKIYRTDKMGEIKLTFK